MQQNDRISSVTAASALTTGTARLYSDNDNDENDADVDEDGAAMQKYCNDINQFDLKFMHYRLLNNGVFVMASCFYIAMDIVPYSGFTWFAGDDDDAMGATAAVQAWVNLYGVLYFVAACLFVVVGSIDLYLVKLGAIRAPHEVEQQIINRAQARVRATTRRRTTMRGVMITIPEDNKSYDDNNDDISHHENNHSMVVVEENNNNIIVEMDHTVHVWIDKMKLRCCCSSRLTSSVVVVSWSSLLAGLFGVGSSVLVVHNLFTSNVLNLISVHLFFIQACAMYYARFSGWRNNKSKTPDACDADTEDHRGSGGRNTTAEQHLANDTDANDEDTTNEDIALRMDTVLEWWYIIGDTAFGIGALIDVIFSYVYLFLGRGFLFQAIVTLLSGILWWTSSIMYGLATLYDYHQLRQDIHDEAKEIDDILTTASQQARCSRRTSSLFLLDRREQRLSQGYKDDVYVSTL